MTFLSPFVVPSISPRPAAESEVLDAHPSSGSSAAPTSSPDWTEEQDRERGARAFVNRAADIALRGSLGALSKSCVCGACGIAFLSASALDDRCHVCVSEEGIRE